MCLEVFGNKLLNVDPFVLYSPVHTFKSSGSLLLRPSHCRLRTKTTTITIAVRQNNMTGFSHFAGKLQLTDNSKKNSHNIYRLTQELLTSEAEMTSSLIIVMWLHCLQSVACQTYKTLHETLTLCLWAHPFCLLYIKNHSGWISNPVMFFSVNEQSFFLFKATIFLRWSHFPSNVVGCMQSDRNLPLLFITPLHWLWAGNIIINSLVSNINIHISLSLTHCSVSNLKMQWQCSCTLSLA